MNNEWNINFFQNSSLDIQHTDSNKFLLTEEFLNIPFWYG